MNMRTTTILTTLISMLLLVPAAAAQSLQDPVVAHAEDKVEEAQSQPVSFVTSHASKDGVVQEAEWGVAYACFAKKYAHDEAGTPDPELEQCKDYEDVLGLEDEKEQIEAEVDNVSDDPVSFVREVSDDAAGTVEDIAEDPASALDEIGEFVSRLVQPLRDVLQAVATMALGVVLVLVQVVLDALGENANIGSQAYGMAMEGVQTALAAVGQVQQTLSTVREALEPVRDAAQAVGQAVMEIVRDLLPDEVGGGSAEPLPVDQEIAGDATGDLFGKVGEVEDLVEGSVR